jgi:hypothetical protein
MARLLTDQALLAFMDGLLSPLQMMKRCRQSWSIRYKMSIFMSFLCFGAFVAYFVLDVFRQKSCDYYANALKEPAEKMFEDFNDFLCRETRCANACNKGDPACPLNNTEAFCRQNCTPTEPLPLPSIADGVRNGDIVIRILFLLICFPMTLAFHPIIALFRVADLRERGLNLTNFPTQTVPITTCKGCSRA